MTPVPGVTVVIPTHNRLDYLREALASVSAQRAPVARLIVVDDGSSDGTGEWLDRQADPAWRVLRQSPAGGGSAARNSGLAECDTPFVLFLDDDDVLRPEAIVTLAAALAAHPQAAGAAGAYRRFGTGIGTGTGPGTGPRDLHPRWRVTAPIWREELFGWNMPPAALLWRTDVVRHLGGWDASLPRAEDRDLNLRAYPRPFALVPDTVMDYRVHPGQPPASAQLEVDRLVLERFVRSLPPADRRVGESIVAARARFDQALASYHARDFRAAFPKLLGVLGGAPTLCASPVLGPWLLGLVTKSAVGLGIPRRWRGSPATASL